MDNRYTCTIHADEMKILVDMVLKPILEYPNMTPMKAVVVLNEAANFLSKMFNVKILNEERK